MADKRILLKCGFVTASSAGLVGLQCVYLWIFCYRFLNMRNVKTENCLRLFFAEFFLLVQLVLEPVKMSKLTHARQSDRNGLLRQNLYFDRHIHVMSGNPRNHSS